MTLKFSEGHHIQLEFETGKASMAPIYYMLFWRRKYPILNKLSSDPRHPSCLNCPYCGELLRTSEARQCLHCGADWPPSHQAARSCGLAWEEQKHPPDIGAGWAYRSVSKSNRPGSRRQNRPHFRQHFLNRLPEPHGQRSFLPSFSASSLSPWTISVRV